MNSSLKLSTATTDDAAAIARLVNSAFIAERAFIEGDRIDPAKVKVLMEKGIFLLLSDVEALAGCLYTELRGQRGYFGLLAVDPQHQGRGVGTRLVAAAEEHCRDGGCRYMDLTYINLREELPGYYRRLGYLENGTLELSRDQVPKIPLYLIRMSKAL